MWSVFKMKYLFFIMIYVNVDEVITSFNKVMDWSNNSIEVQWSKIQLWWSCILVEWSKCTYEWSSDHSSSYAQESLKVINSLDEWMK